MADIMEELHYYGIPRAQVKPIFTTDEKLQLKMSGKQRAEQERRPRIFDAKRRTIGCDKEYLDQQCEQKEQLNKLRMEQDKALDGMGVTVDKQLKLLEIEKNRVKREMERDCKEFSIENLNFTQRKEYDLNDKDALKKETPARIGDDDPRCGIASMQQFTGEDLMKRDRVKKQHELQANWIEQQIYEKKLSENANKGDEADFAAQVQAITTLRNEIEGQEDALRKDLSLAQQTYNLQQAQVATGVRRAGAAVDNVANEGEMKHHAQDPFLNETIPRLVENGRIRRDNYKGSYRDERWDVRVFVEGQMQEADERKKISKVESKMVDVETEQTRRQLILLEREKQRLRREAASAVMNENRQLAVVQREKEKHLKDTVYRNRCDDGYFTQFGTTCR